jgi:hypothetical protein
MEMPTPTDEHSRLHVLLEWSGEETLWPFGSTPWGSSYQGHHAVNGRATRSRFA